MLPYERAKVGFPRKILFGNQKALPSYSPIIVTEGKSTVSWKRPRSPLLCCFPGVGLQGVLWAEHGVSHDRTRRSPCYAQALNLY